MKYYKLRNDLNNPSPDRRATRSWEKSVTWRKGTVFGFDRYDNNSSWVSRVGERFGAIMDGHQRAAILANSDEVPESSQALVERLCMSYSTLGFLQYLVDSGRLSPEDFEREWNTFTQEEGDA